jgi:hypothetical protein
MAARDGVMGGTSRSKMQTGLLAIIFIGVLYIVYSVFNPITMWRNSSYQALVKDVSTRANVNPADLQYIGRINEDAALKDVEEIKKESPINAEVYKDAQNGDYVLAYRTKMVIYNEDDDKVVYDGDTPAMKQAKGQEEMVKKAVESLKAKGIVASDNKDTPQVALVSDPKALAANNFYRDAKAGDMVLSFASTGTAVIYRAEGDVVVNVASLKFQEAN